MEKRHIRKLLEKYLLGRANATENTTVDSWYQSFDNKPVGLSEEEAEVIGREIWERIESAALGTVPMGDTAFGRSGGRVRRLLPGWARVAAAVLIIVLGSASVYFWLLRNPGTPQFATITTRIGEKKIVTLEDGSILTLDAGTSIRVMARHVELTDGQVFFDVKKDDSHPFVIHTGELTTTVLGTSFTISAYQGLHNLNIGVVTGRVKVQSDSNTLAILEKNEELSYDKTSKSYRTIGLDESMTAWQQGRLVMNDLSFSDMAVLMQKNFGVVITTSQDSIKHTKYTTELLRSMTAEEAVEVLAAIHHLKIKKQDNKFYLYK